MKIAIYGQRVDETTIPYIQELISELESNNIELTIYKNFFDLLASKIIINHKFDLFNSNRNLDKKTDFLISIGGDGTFLSTLDIIRDNNIPILGINIGRLGFLSSVRKEEIKTAINSLITKDFAIEQRSLICIDHPKCIMGEVNFAMNEVYILKTDEDSMIKINLYGNNEFINTYWADGLIIATPTGSTGYSLSCGGPIVSPQSENFIITPISSHNLTVRPIVIPDSIELMLEVETRSPNVILGMDSKKIKIKTEQKIIIKKEKFIINLIKIGEHNFYSTIRNKLMWGKDARN